MDIQLAKHFRNNPKVINQVPVARSTVDANHWSRSIETYKFQCWLKQISIYNASRITCQVV